MSQPGSARSGQQGYASQPGSATAAAEAAAHASEQQDYHAAVSGAEAPTGAAAVAAADEAAAEGSYSPAEYLEQLEAHLVGLQQQRRELQQQLAGAAAGAYQQISQRLGTAGTGVPLPADLPALVDELAVLQAVRQYLAYAQELQALTRHVEKAVRALQQQQQQEAAAAASGVPGGSLGSRATTAAGSPESAAFLQALSEAVDGFSSAVGYAIAVKQLTGGPPSSLLAGWLAGWPGRGSS